MNMKMIYKGFVVGSVLISSASAFAGSFDCSAKWYSTTKTEDVSGTIVSDVSIKSLKNTSGTVNSSETIKADASYEPDSAEHQNFQKFIYKLDGEACHLLLPKKLNSISADFKGFEKCKARHKGWLSLSCKFSK